MDQNGIGPRFIGHLYQHAAQSSSNIGPRHGQAGAAAFRLAEKGIHGQMVALVGGEVVSVTLEEALAEPNRVDPNGDGVLTARNLGLSMGD